MAGKRGCSVLRNGTTNGGRPPGEVFCGRYETIVYRWEYITINGIPVPLYKYREGFFDNIYSESLNAVKGKVYNTYCPEDKAVKDWFWIDNNLFKLPTPLEDYSYNFIKDPINTHPASGYKGLGCAEIKTIYNDKIKSKDQFKSKDNHPYGIRNHGSQSEEYYYDVLEFFTNVYDQGTMEDPDKQEE